MIKTVPIDQVRTDPSQPRKIFSESYIAGLAKNLEIEGMINPIEVNPLHNNNYKIITGECRLRAAKKAKWDEVPININDRKFSAYTRFRHQMAENLHQSAAGGASPMNAIDVARGYQKMLKMLGYKWSAADQLTKGRLGSGIRKLSRELGISHQTISSYLALLQEPKYVLEDIQKGKPFSQYRETKGIPEKYQEAIKRAIAEGKITNKRAIRRFRTLALARPDKAEVEFLRITQQQSEDANRILNRAIELSLALKKANPNKLIFKDKQMILLQLRSTNGSLRRFIGELKKAENVIEGEIVE